MKQCTRKKESRKLKPYNPKDFKGLTYKEKIEYLIVAGICRAVFSSKK